MPVCPWKAPVAEELERVQFRATMPVRKAKA